MNLFEMLLGNMSKYEEYEGEVFFDTKVKRFLQLRGKHDDYLIFGGFTEYYNDAKTHRGDQRLSYEYAESLMRIDTLDTIPDIYYDGIGWRTKWGGILKEKSDE